MELRPLLFGFQGRINRGKYWLTLLVVPLWLLLLLSLVFWAISDSFAQNFDRDSTLAWILALLPVCLFGVPILVIIVWSSAAVAIKRLHDRDRSGWWIVAFYVIPSLLGKVTDVMSHTAGMILGSVAVAISIWAFVELACLKGTSGSNRFGPDPLLRVPAARRVRA